MEIVHWLDSQKLDYESITQRIFVIDGKSYFWLEDSEKIISEDFTVLCSSEEMDLIESSTHPINRIAFLFGEKWYWTPIDGDTKFNPLRYLGKEKTEFPTPESTPFLGLHGKFELLNGTRDYDDWCQKAKFLGFDTLAIVEAQTLAGTMVFQEICQKNNIKSILGQTAYVKNKDQFYWIKLLVKNKVGWRNLLKINKAQTVDNWQDKFVDEDFLVKHSEGLIAILNPSIKLKQWNSKKLSKAFSEIYYQIDLTKWDGVKHDINWFENIQNYFKEFSAVLKPLIFDDAYYLDSIDNYTKKASNFIGKIDNQRLSKDQHFKSLEEVYNRFSLFVDSQDLFFESLENSIEINNLCDFSIETKNRYLPKYKMNEAEKTEFKTNLDLFWYKVNLGLEKKVNGKVSEEEYQVYLDRIEEESTLLIKGDIIDYFLIISDINQWCLNNGIIVGHGRGSAAGCLISFLTDITQVDPIKYDLLFSRFLTEGRLKSSLPDIDIDYGNRNAVIEYMKEKYGRNYVASVATYGNLKIKNAIKDFSRIAGINIKDANYITGLIRKDYEAADFTKVIELATKIPKLRYFILQNPRVFEHFDLVLHQTRTASIHACATIIVPEIDENGDSVDIHDLIPTKLINGELVTEWEGAQLEKTGYLKEDILGLKQLEKFDGFLKLIKKNHGVEIDIYQISLEDEEVFEEFGKGLTEDVFQFGTSGLKNYCRALKPESIMELAAANSLFRPGAMESNSHTEYIEMKFGKKESYQYFLLDEITESTYGIMAYQEQIIKAYSIITDSTLEEAVNFQKYITKAYKLKARGIVDTEYLKHQDLFISKYVEKGQSPKEAEKIWEKIQNFASYSFNLSHSVSYSIIGYISQWFKVNYPIEFWTTSLNESNDETRPSRLNEIAIRGRIKVSPVDVNESALEFVGNNETQSIYWSIGSVKWLGQVAAGLIIHERNENGRFFSIKEFIERMKGTRVNKRSITNLILSGGFDIMYSVKVESERLFILDEYYALNESTKDLEKYLPYAKNKIWWQIMQTELTGFGGISYEQLVKQHKFKDYSSDVQDMDLHSYVSVAGMVTSCKVKNSPKIGDFAILEMNCNNKVNNVVIWSETFEQFKEIILDCENKIVILNGQVKFDKFSGMNNIQSNRTTKLISL